MLVTMPGVQVRKLFVAALIILLASDVSGQSFLTGDFFSTASELHVVFSASFT